MSDLPPTNIWDYPTGSSDGPPPDWTQHLWFTTVRIETESKIATGALYQPSETTDGPTFLVTNRHVVRGATTIRLFLLAASGNGPFYGESVEIELDFVRHQWHEHPSSEIDLAATSFDRIVNDLLERGEAPYYLTIGNWSPNETDLHLHDWAAEVLFVGYPRGLYDQVSLTPILRRGITATPIHRTWWGREAFLVDAFIVTGSSGSPVFCVATGTFRGEQGMNFGSRITFLGIVGRSIAEETSEGRDYHNLGVVFNWRSVAEVIDLVGR